MCWHLLLEEYGIIWKYIPSSTNEIADLLSRHPLVEAKRSIMVNAEVLALSPLEEEEKFPLDMTCIINEQL